MGFGERNPLWCCKPGEIGVKIALPPNEMEPKLAPLGETRPFVWLWKHNGPPAPKGPPCLPKNPRVGMKLETLKGLWPQLKFWLGPQMNPRGNWLAPKKVEIWNLGMNEIGWNCPLEFGPWGVEPKELVFEKGVCLNLKNPKRIWVAAKIVWPGCWETDDA